MRLSHSIRKMESFRFRQEFRRQSTAPRIFCLFKYFWERNQLVCARQYGIQQRTGRFGKQMTKTKYQLIPKRSTNITSFES